MSHGIEENDKGYVYHPQGEPCWHKLPQYKVQTFPVLYKQCREVLDYPLEKRELFAEREGELVATGVYEAYREDTGDVLMPSCSKTFDLINNVDLFDSIKTRILDPHPDIEIESVGTLFNGQTAYVNMLLGKYAIKGDESSTFNRLMYYNSLGKGSYKTCAHNVRVLCNNTLRAAEAQGAANQIKVRHTRNAKAKMEDAIEELLGIKKGFDKLQDKLNHLTTIKFKRKVDVEQFIKNNWFYDKNPSDKRLKKVMDSVFKVYEDTRDEYSKSIQGSKYQLLQAYTNLIDKAGKKSDDGYRFYDGVVGIRAGMKDKVLKHLLKS